MKVIAFTKYGRAAASTRQRVLQYLPALSRAGIEVEHHALLGDDYVASLATGHGYSRRGVVQAYLSRFRDLLKGPDCDLIWIYAELFPYLPAGFEGLAARSGKPIVYDIDDAFFHTYEHHDRRLVRSLLGHKLEPLMASASACCCGNEYLRNHAIRFCPNSIVLPTVVDTEVYQPTLKSQRNTPVIGWIGSPSSWCNVQPLLPVLQTLAESGAARVRVIGAGVDAERDRFPGLEMVEWSEATEVNEVQDIDIGIMPLLDRPFQRGKSGFKLIQYMSCQIPVVASPVGVNTHIIDQGQTGFLSKTHEEWHTALALLLGSPEMRERMGKVGRAQVEADYSLASQAPRLSEIMLQAAGRA